MRKRNILTVLGLTAALVIAFGGWRLTSALLDGHEARLLSGSGEMALVMEDQSSLLANTGDSGGSAEDENFDFYGDYEEGTETETQQVKFSEEEIAAILTEWDEIDGTYAHEPGMGQLTMEEAVTVAREAMYGLVENGLIPVGSYSDDFTDAYLRAPLSEGENLTVANAAGSFWTVILSQEYTKSTFFIHALSGDIWSADIEFTTAQPLSQIKDRESFLMKYLVGYAAGFELGEIKRMGMLEENAAYCSFEESLVYAMVILTSVPQAQDLPEQETVYLHMGIYRGMPGDGGVFSGSGGDAQAGD